MQTPPAGHVSPLRILALLLILVGGLASVGPARAVEAVRVGLDQPVIDLTGAIERYRSDGDLVQISTAAGKDGIKRRIVVKARDAGARPDWIAFALTNANLKRLPRHERRHRLDYPGAALMVAGSVTLLLALSWGGVRYPWDSAPVLALLAGAAVLGGGFAARLATAPEPLIPTEVLRDRVVYSATLAACFAMGTFIGLTIYVPIFLEGVIGLSASESGVALVPLMIGTVTGATLSGRSMLHFRHYKRVPLAMMCVSLACCATIAWQGRALPFWLMEVLFALLSMGIGTILPLSTISIQNAVETHQLGIATAAMNFFRSLGGALIVAAFGTIVLGGAAGGAGGGAHDVESLIRGADPAQLALTFRYVFLAACLGLLGAFTFLALMEERPLRERTSPKMAAEKMAAETPEASA